MKHDANTHRKMPQSKQQVAAKVKQLAAAAAAAKVQDMQRI